ncbi:site-2 protease family protein [Terrilactibacillus sp. S3-3]|nr:site-2 protease family protein [Terrilactibacillus sp. S3-3]
MFLNYNAMIFFFNLFPIWPLDGGKLLQLILLKIYPFKKACEMALTLSIAMLILLTVIMVTFFPFTLNFLLIGLFLAAAIYKEWKARSFVFSFAFFLPAGKNRFNQKKKRKKIIVPASMPVAAVFSRFYKDVQHQIIVKGIERSFVDQSALIAAFFSGECKGKTIGEFLKWKGQRLGCPRPFCR